MTIATRLLFALLVLAAALALPSHPTRAATDEVAAGPNLQGMVLTTDDLGLAGMTDYRIDRASGQPRTPAELAVDAVAGGFTTIARAEAVLFAGGATGGYCQVYRLKYPNDPVAAVDTAREVTVTLLAFTDADAAAAAFGPVAQLYSRDGQVIAPAATIGDESLLMTAPVEYQLYPDLSLTIRVGTVIANVSLHDDVGQPEAATVQMLASLLSERIVGVGGVDRVVLL